MKCVKLNYFADKLNEELLINGSYWNPGCDENNEKVISALLITIDHFLEKQQSTRKQIDENIHELGKVGYVPVRDAILKTKKRAGTVNIAFYGESHKILADAIRIQQVLENEKQDKQELIVIERDLWRKHKREGKVVAYNTEDCTCLILQEDELTRSINAPAEYQLQYNNVFGMGMNAKQRSMIVAAYLTICLTNNNPRDIVNIAIVFGENHKDIIYYQEFFIHNIAFSLGARRHNYFIVESMGEY